MTRTQIQLTNEQYRAIKDRARREKLSLSAAIRQAVELWLGRSERSRTIERSLASLGRFRSRARDVSRRHDAYLAEIYQKG